MRGKSSLPLDLQKAPVPWKLVLSGQPTVNTHGREMVEATVELVKLIENLYVTMQRAVRP